MEINKTALGLALGIMTGIAVFVATVWVLAVGGGQHMNLLGRFYLGYSLSIPGAFVGLVYGFIDGFIGGWIIGLLYNIFAKPKSAVA
jgi:hypothetical protein